MRRKDGRWTAAISVGGGRRQHFSGRTRREVQTQLTAALRARDQGLAITTSRQRLDSCLEEWLTAITPNVRRSTWITDTGRVRNHIIPALGRIALGDLTPADVERFMSVELAEGLSPQTVIHLRGILRRALQRAVRHGGLARNAAGLAVPPRLPKAAVPLPYSPGEARTLLQAIRGDRLEALWIVYLTKELARLSVWPELGYPARSGQNSSLSELGSHPEGPQTSTAQPPRGALPPIRAPGTEASR